VTPRDIRLGEKCRCPESGECGGNANFGSGGHRNGVCGTGDKKDHQIGSSE